MNAHALVEALMNLVGDASIYVLWLLIGLSVWATAIIVERLLFYRATLGPLRAAVQDTRAALSAAPAAAWQPPEMSVLDDAYRHIWHAKESESASLARLGDATGRLRRLMMQRANVLGTLGANTPFIGLLGTVFGIIQAFRQLAETTGKGADTVMAGIAEALVATGLGLLVAIPCVLFYNYFSRATQQAADEIEEVGKWLLASRKR